MRSSGSPVLADSSGESLDSEPHVIQRTLPAHMEAARHVIICDFIHKGSPGHG